MERRLPKRIARRYGGSPEGVMASTHFTNIDQILIKRDGLEGIIMMANPGVSYYNLTSADRSLYLLLWRITSFVKTV
jgi:hypothetical protein